MPEIADRRHQDVILTPEEAADYLRVDRETVYRRLRAGRLPGNKVGGQWRLRKVDLEDYLQGTTDTQILQRIVIYRGDILATGKSESLVSSTGLHRKVHLYDKRIGREFIVGSVADLDAYMQRTCSTDFVDIFQRAQELGLTWTGMSEELSSTTGQHQRHEVMDPRNGERFWATCVAEVDAFLVARGASS